MKKLLNHFGKKSAGILLMILVLCLSGCGKKGDPVPPDPFSQVIRQIHRL